MPVEDLRIGTYLLFKRVSLTAYNRRNPVAAFARTWAAWLERAACTKCSKPAWNISWADISSQKSEHLLETMKNKTVETTSLSDKWTVNFGNSQGPLDLLILGIFTVSPRF